MIGPILLALSWLLLRLEGRGLNTIGIDQPRRRSIEFAVGFVALGLAVGTQQLGLALSAGDAFVANTDFGVRDLVSALRFTINSVLYEELLFRGYLLYRAIQWFGTTRAVLLSAAAFGVYHWFTYNAFGNPAMMAFVFLMTGMFGYVWARAFVATGSVALPIGLHLGWNTVANVVFSGGPLGRALLVPRSGASHINASSSAGAIFNIAFPVLIAVVLLWYLRRIDAVRVRTPSPAM